MQASQLSLLSSAVLEWSCAEQSPFDDEQLPSKHTKGYLSTPEVYERLAALVECGDIEYEADEPFTQADVSAALHALYDRQQKQLEPLGMLSRQRMGIGRLWRIVPLPPSDDGARGATPAGVTSILYRLVNAEDASARSSIAEELLEAMGELDSLCGLLEAIATAAAPLPGSPIDYQLLITAVNDALNEADAAARERLDGSGGAAAAPPPSTPAGARARRTNKSGMIKALG